MCYRISNILSIGANRQILQTWPIVNCIEMSKQAQIAAQKAEQHARETELYANTAQITLQRLQRLVEPDFDGEGLTAIKELVRNAGVGIVGE